MTPSDLSDAIDSRLAEVNTTLPGEIVSWDGRLAVVRPAMGKRLANGDVLQPPRIVSVPVQFPVAAGGRAVISVPLSAGDPVLLHFAQRAVESWLSGSKDAPDDPRQYDISDAFASPMLAPFAGVSADTANLVMRFGPGVFKIAPGGDMTIDAPTLTINANQTTINSKTLITERTQINDQMQVTGPVQMNATLQVDSGINSGIPGTAGSGNMTIRGRVNADNATIAGVDFAGHRHVEHGTGGGVTDPPM